MAEHPPLCHPRFEEYGPNPMTTVKIPPAHKNTGIEARCAATGMRMTEQRRVIARVLAEAMEHPDLDGVSHRQAVRGCRHHRTSRLPRGPRALRADAREPSRPSDQSARRQGH